MDGNMAALEFIKFSSHCTVLLASVNKLFVGYYLTCNQVNFGAE
jgi:hypothetical protein